MRNRAEWMKPADDAILEYVRDAGEVPPAVIARNVDLHPKYTGERARMLAKYGLLNREEGYYSLTPDGASFLKGELDAADLEAEDG